MIKRIATATAALAGAATLAACGPSDSATPAPQSQAQSPPRTTSAPSSTESANATTAATTTGASTETPRCATSALKLEVGTPVEDQDSPGQFTMDLTYRNTSQRTCALYGVPGVDLQGPDNPNGPVYHLPRVDNGVKYNEVPPGSAASASLTFLVPDGPAETWIPTTIVTTPPGQTTQLTAPWPNGSPVLRQDAATRPGTYVNGILGTTS
ncbi:DUF4232 domain-containing protein [Actinokineospora bangkokensis]|uniref:DUF4232 domain-containing protein n=1 Tax=Actinokineospora bangkokensis TaxID=1193682 RepID=A0A1Q9LIK3_9PSEU|nr:DUF4232 domain-containing protein [Actinokineospora bangkokensis]OLR91825.1 hypothetical protein BJP25_23580 [Actinokineospora bangkokensis]